MHAHAYTFPATDSSALHSLFTLRPLTQYISIYILATALKRHTTRHAPMNTRHATLERYDARDHMWGYVTRFDRYGSVYDWSRAAWSHVIDAGDHGSGVHYRTDL
jgi:hypothetical protein